MRLMRLAAAAVLLSLVAATGCSSGGKQKNAAATPSQPAKVILWHGYTDAEAKTIKSLASQFNAGHRDVQVTVQFQGNNDYALQKVLTALAGGKYPDIAYLYGSDAAQIARRGIVKFCGSPVRA